MDWAGLAKELAVGSIKTVLLITSILMVLMVALELIKDAHLLDRAARFMRPVMRLFRLPDRAAYPLLAGVVFGISFGSGVIIAFARDGRLSLRDMTLVGVFLAICHGMIEDPLVFVAFGASWWIVVLTRVLAAAATMILVSRVLTSRLPSADASPPTES
jgi:Fe2+ transport system protein B